MKKQQHPSKTRIFNSGSEEETIRIAEQLAAGFQGDEAVLLFGALGAGKTVFAKGIASALGIRDVTQVCSPSYTLMNVYQAKYPIYHMDLYRLTSEEELLDLGWEDYLGQGIVIVEWAEKMTFSYESIRVTIRVLNDERRRIGIDLPLF
ncbi:MAG: tRNA (adenosine(37)-N6)-threonylcarbamoyltransferase complex ATPase subunit type 1 TsaE [Candidatus Aminicenantes bacterium]|nr:tRNA (adenosine(37)-N6)-threonylcarbamoyltransferase complex ATPase subunit type 1 TsaE [Candidatus Aminicenantes bacterium]